ncbi:MAG: hypothetical protein P4K86_00560 [Terracidiphilus sp.]|nr:hypothetical protein [Terracidiphilus sp.]MDR3776023.1 hypothetical protein [Terracidiphilus sp.]
MDDHDIVLAMAICEILGESVKPDVVEREFEKAKERLYRIRHPREPRQAKLTHAIRRDVTE